MAAGGFIIHVLKYFSSKIFVVLADTLRKVSYHCNCENSDGIDEGLSEIRKVQRGVRDHCHQYETVVQRYGSLYSDWLISVDQSTDPIRGAASMLSSKYEKFTVVFPKSK